MPYVSTNSASILLLVSLSGCSPASGVAAEVCPEQHAQALRFVDVYDGPVQDLATLVPDKAWETPTWSSHATALLVAR